MASFTASEIQKFREIFRERSESAEGGLSLEAFAPAAEACLASAGLPEPPPGYLGSQFRRLSTTGTVPWQQFFQVLIHCHLNYIPGTGYREEAVPSSRSNTHTPDPSANHHHQPPTSGDEVTSSSSRGRVGFVDSPDIVNVESYAEQRERSITQEPLTTLSRTLARGGAFLSRTVGNFFGMTEESVQGTSEQAGWADVARANAVDHFSTGRHLSFLAGLPAEPPPEYPGPPTAGVGGHSFDPSELVDSSDEDEADNLFIAPPPPDYQDVVGSEPPGQQVSVEVHAPQTNSSHHPMDHRSSTTPLITPQTPPVQPQQYPPPTRVAQRPQAVSEGAPDFIYDAEDAWNYYKRFIQAERSLRQRRHHQGAFEFFGSIDAVESNANVAPTDVERRGSLRRDRLGSASQGVELRPRKKKKRTKLQRQSTLVRHKVESLPSFTPWFIIVMSIIQLVVLVVLIAINGGVAEIRAIPIRHNDRFPSLKAPNGTEKVTYHEAVNLWIGLAPKDLVRIGAKFTPCMREDFHIRDRNTEEIGNNLDRLGCCRNGDSVGITFEPQDCVCFAENTRGNTCLNQGNTSVNGYHIGTCSENFDNSSLGLANFHPCCVSLTGLCLHTSLEECDARGGYFYPTRESCAEINCLQEICGFNGASVGADPGTPYLPRANQFWRFFLSIFIHLGVIHIVLLLPIQVYIGFKIERTIGWLRMGLIYLIAGVGGNIVSGVFVPYGVNAGASGAVFGLIGVLFVELFQFWQIVDRALLELLKLLGFAAFLLALGTLPFIDNMAHIGGLLFGVVAAIIFVPYITFGKLDAVRKRILLAICIPLLITLFVAGLLTFYLIPNPSFCPWCGYINCIPYQPELCPSEYRVVDPEEFSL